jgi:LEA14-like dessication related protein
VRRLSLALALLSVVTLAGGCGPLFEKPRVSVKRVDVTSISFQGISFDIVFTVVNPNVIGLDLARLSYQLKVDNHQFVAGGANRPLHVPAEGTGELHLPVSFRFVELAEALVALFQKTIVPYSIATTLGFGTPIGVFDVPIAHSGTFPVPRPPNISIARAAVGRVSGSGADVQIALHLQNPNSFVLPLGNLNYQLTLDGAPLAQAGTGPLQLAAGAAHEVMVSAHADFIQAGLGLLRAIESRSATVALEGTMDLGGFTLPVRASTTLQ